MKKIIIFILFYCTICFAQTQTLNIGTNTIGVIFANKTLMQNQYDKIVADMQTCVGTQWGKKAKIDMYSKYHIELYSNILIKSNFVACINGIDRTSFYPEKYEFPRNLVTNNVGALCLYIPEELCNAYTNAFAFAVANSNIVAAAYDFASFIASSNFVTTVSSNQISNYFWSKKYPPEIYLEKSDEIKQGIFTDFTYYTPSVLGFYYENTRSNETNLWCVIPASSEEYTYTMFEPTGAIWHDGKWKMTLFFDEMY